MSDPLADAITDLQEQEAVRLATETLSGDADPMDVLTSAQAGMTRVGELFESGEYFLSELIFSGAIFKQVAALVREQLKGRSGGESKGTVVIGTVTGDVHDLGKNIVVMLLESSGYTVVDLGVDVPPEVFVEKVKETGATVLGISALITTAFAGMKQIVALLDEKGLRPEVKVMIGGGVVDESCRAFTGADVQSKSAYEAVLFCDRFYGHTK